MSLADAERLRKIHTFPSLVKYLRDDLGWPIESDDFEEITFEYEPAELGLDPKTAVKVEKIMQLRPLTTNQPFGIFFLQFQPKRLPVVVLRRILQSLALKKRASANKADRAAWKKNDLLFISAHGEEQQRTITFAHFREDEYQPGDLPTLRVLGWDDRDTVLHLGDVHETLTRSLSWPRDEEDVDTWRQKWCSAFSLRHREVITTSKRLAVRLAELARVIRNRASAVLDVEDKRKGKEGPLTKLHRVFQTALIHDLSEDDFADMYAQTIAYGLLSARVSRPAGLVADNITDMVPVTNPFLKEMLEEFLHVGGRKKRGKTGLDFDELGVTEVVETLRSIDMQAVLRDFGDRNPQEDPVIHFYELFLKEYDAKKRMQRGVFYTPRPVVSYIVRSVHELLQTEFGLEDGLADTTTWAEMIKRFPAKPGKKGDDAKEGLKIPEGTPPGQAFVQILDPATGTGTFLVEAIDVIHKTMVKKWEGQGHGAPKISALWNDYVPKNLLPRLHGYEIMMAPYAIAHMKIGLKLYETGYRFQSDERARIYLTNTLEPPQDFSGHFDFDIPALAHEAEAVNEVKRKQRFTVVIGNPPYAGWSANLTPTARRLVDPYRYVGDKRIKEKGALQFEKNLQDDYVKFFAWSQRTSTATSLGVLAFISNNGFLDTPTLRGMRWSLLDTFAYLRFLDLQGSTKRPVNGDENVFDIQQGVAISILAKTAHKSSTSSVMRAQLSGSRSQKYDYLSKACILQTAWKEIHPLPPLFQFLSLNSHLQSEYMQYPSLTDIMPFYSSGTETGFDTLMVDFSKEELLTKIQSFLDPKKTSGQIAAELSIRGGTALKLLDDRDAFRRDFEMHGPEYCQEGLYRVFDRRVYYYKKEYLKTNSSNVMSHLMRGRNIALIAFRQQSLAGFQHVFVTRKLGDKNAVSLRTREINYYFPFHIFHQSEGLRFDDMGSVNVSPEFLKILTKSLGLCTDARSEATVIITADNVFDYMYAILHSLAYRTRYEKLLMSDFPRIPIPENLELFRGLADLGDRLVCLHLLESPKVEQFITTYTGPKNPEVERVGWSKGTVWLDAGKTNAREGHRAAKPGTIGFKGVPEQVWDFHIGGYQVCHKWLKDRQGRTLSDDDIAHYQKIIVALNETLRIMAEIDHVIDQHGGWPDAFQSGTDTEK